MFEHPFSEEIFPNVQSQPHPAQFDALSSRPITCYPEEETDPHLSTTAATAESSEEHLDTLSPYARSHSNVLAAVTGCGPPSIGARLRRLQQRSGLHSRPPAGTGTTPAYLSPEGPFSRGSPGAGGSWGGQSVPPAPAHPASSGRVRRGNAPGTHPRERGGLQAQLCQGLRRAQDGAGGVRWRRGPAALPSSIPPFRPPRGWSLPWAAPPAPPRSVTPVRAPPPVSAGRSWGRVLPYLRRSPSTRPHPARPRDARVRPGDRKSVV